MGRPTAMTHDSSQQVTRRRADLLRLSAKVTVTIHAKPRLTQRSHLHLAQTFTSHDGPARVNPPLAFSSSSPPAVPPSPRLRSLHASITRPFLPLLAPLRRPPLTLAAVQATASCASAHSPSGPRPDPSVLLLAPGPWRRSATWKRWPSASTTAVSVCPLASDSCTSHSLLPDLKARANLVEQIRDNFESYGQGPQYAAFLNHFVPVFLKILDGPPSFTSNSPEQVPVPSPQEPEPANPSEAPPLPCPGDDAPPPSAACRRDQPAHAEHRRQADRAHQNR